MDIEFMGMKGNWLYVDKETGALVKNQYGKGKDGMSVTLTMLAIERVGASAVSQAGMIGPMSTIIMGILILDEPFSISLVIGTLLVLAGVYITNRR